MIFSKRNIILKFMLLLFIMSFNTKLSSQSFRIMLDENYSDWESIPPLYADDTGDNSGIDFQKVKATSFNGYLFSIWNSGAK